MDLLIDILLLKASEKTLLIALESIFPASSQYQLIQRREPAQSQPHLNPSLLSQALGFFLQQPWLVACQHGYNKPGAETVDLSTPSSRPGYVDHGRHPQQDRHIA